MYLKKLTLINTGPISRAALDFPMRPLAADATLNPTSIESPVPVVLVGENGSGKSICLSHIVDAMMKFQQAAYPETPEVQKGKVYKYWSSSYIKMGSDFYFGRTEFYGGKKYEELVLSKPKKDFTNAPEGIPSDFSEWKFIPPEQWHYLSPIGDFDARKFFDKNCVLYLPPNRFEDPAWLNAENLNSKVQRLGIKNLVGHSNRVVITESPMRMNQNWLFEVAFDLLGHDDQASNLHNAANSIVKTCLRKKGNTGIMIGPRQQRTLMLVEKIGSINQLIVSNIFQLSTGETALLNLFLSILRDYDMSRANFKTLDQIQGTVIVDEIDLHLHAVHQYEVLPALIKMLPRVQFILTSHSPLFVLGMQKLFGNDGFALYRLPEGLQISAEEFNEFESAYDAFAKTRHFTKHLQAEIEKSQTPVLFMEGKFDIAYLEHAATLLGRESTLDKIRLIDGGGYGGLRKIWKHFDSKLPVTIPHKVILLFDCDVESASDRHKEGILFSRKLRKYSHPLEKGIENLFSQETLEKVRKKGMGIIHTTPSTVRKSDDGSEEKIPEKWEIKDDSRKATLCEWLCEHGTQDDFQHFAEIFDMLEKNSRATIRVPIRCLFVRSAIKQGKRGGLISEWKSDIFAYRSIFCRKRLRQKIVIHYEK